MQKGYNEIQSVEIELRILEQTSAPPSRPREYLEHETTHSILVEEKQSVPSSLHPPTIRIKKVRFIDEIWFSFFPVEFSHFTGRGEKNYLGRGDPISCFLSSTHFFSRSFLNCTNI